MGPKLYIQYTTSSQSLGKLGTNTWFLQQIRPLIIKYLDLLQWSNFLIYLGQRHALQPSYFYSTANISLASLFSLQVFLISSLRVFFLGFRFITIIKFLTLQFQDLLSSLFRIARLTFFCGKTIWSQCYRYLLLILADTTPRRWLRVSKIIAFVLGLQVIIKLNQKRNLA